MDQINQCPTQAALIETIQILGGNCSQNGKNLVVSLPFEGVMVSSQKEIVPDFSGAFLDALREVEFYRDKMTQIE